MSYFAFSGFARVYAGTLDTTNPNQVRYARVAHTLAFYFSNYLCITHFLNFAASLA
jgi:hypothetical protein